MISWLFQFFFTGQAPIVTAEDRYLAILQAIAAKVRTLNVASGYHVSVKPTSVVVDPDNPFNVPSSELPWCLVEPNVGGRRQWWPSLEVEDVFPVLITVRAAAVGIDPFRKTALALNILGDLEKALATDRTLGGLTFDLRCQAIEPPPIPGFESDQDVFVLMPVEAYYNRTYGQP